MKTTLLLCLFSGLVYGAPVYAQSTDEYDELTYEDLVNQLSRKKQKVIRAQESNPLDEIGMHAGLGLITAFNSMKVGDRSFVRTSQGFELSLGIDLFSRAWAAEAGLRNFGTQEGGSEKRSLREFDLKVIHRTAMGDQLGSRMGGGIGTRYLKYSDFSRQISIEEEIPCMVGFVGLEAFAAERIKLAADMGLRSALLDSSSDKTSLDLMVRLDTTF